MEANTTNGKDKTLGIKFSNSSSREYTRTALGQVSSACIRPTVCCVVAFYSKLINYLLMSVPQ